MAKSMTGEYTFAIFAVTVIALVLSWFASVYFVPYLGLLLLKKPPHAAKLPPEVASGEVSAEEAASTPMQVSMSCSTRRSTTAFAAR
jgi:multidrug efflux pump subunit AcrB